MALLPYAAPVGRTQTFCYLLFFELRKQRREQGRATKHPQFQVITAAYRQEEAAMTRPWLENGDTEELAAHGHDMVIILLMASP